MSELNKMTKKELITRCMLLEAKRRKAWVKYYSVKEHIADLKNIISNLENVILNNENDQDINPPNYEDIDK